MGFIITKRRKKGRLPAGQVWVEIKPQHWYEWGDEPRGMVSTFAYDKYGNYHYTGLMPNSVKQDLKFHNPHS